MYPVLTRDVVFNGFMILLIFFTIVTSVVYFFPRSIPFSFFEFWTVKKTLAEGIYAAWPLFVWGISMTLFLFRFDYANLPFFGAGRVFYEGLLVSLWAGIFEEILFRWICFFFFLMIIPLLNWFLLGFMGINVVQWVFETLFVPITNLTSLGLLETYLLESHTWIIGAAIITSNFYYSRVHKHAGFVACVNAWFLGIYFFYLTFNYGLVAAILAHFLYDLLIFLVFVFTIIQKSYSTKYS